MIEAWQQALRDSLTTTVELAERFSVDAASLQAVVEKYPLRIPPYYLNLIERVGDPIWRQVVPALEELNGDGLVDPLAEENLSPVPTVIHRYPDRVIFYVSGNCASYCRFCTRKRKVGCAEQGVSFRELRDGIDYIRDNRQIRDVVFSGGDPLLLPDSVLDDLLARIYAIPHVEVIRIGSRIPVTLPERITDKLCLMLKKYPPLYLNTHFNHPRELTPEAAEACRRLADAGIVLGNQTVLLRGVNDDADTLRQLFRGLLKVRVRPYYLHQMDLTRGTSHFRTSLDDGLNLVKSLRGTVSGLAIPHYVIDLPGGKGKVPLVAQQVSRRGSRVLIEAADGSVVEYPDLPLKTPVQGSLL